MVSSTAFEQKPSANGSSPLFPKSFHTNNQANLFAAPLLSSKSGQPPLGIQHGGSGIAPYAVTKTTKKEVSVYLMSISSMAVYDRKSHEELRWEDYQQTTKANAFSASQSSRENGQPPLVSQHGGSRIAPYIASKADGKDSAELVSISAMPVYAKSHEELRWEDYLLITQGGNGFGSLNRNSNLSIPSPLSLTNQFPFPGSQTTVNVVEVPNSSPALNLLPVKDPFGVASSESQLLSDPAKCASTSQIGITSMPVVDKPAPSSVSQAQTASQLNTCQPKSDVTFVIPEDQHGIPRPVNHPMSRENPKSAFKKVVEPTNDALNRKPVQLNDTTKNSADDSLETTDGEPVVLPKLTHPEYYTEPPIPEMQVKETTCDGGTQSCPEMTSNNNSPSLAPSTGTQPSLFGCTGSSGSSLGCDSFEQKPSANCSSPLFPTSFHTNNQANPFAAPLLSSKSGQPPLGSQHGGSGIAPYAVTKTTEKEVSVYLMSISSMAVFGRKSHEELRWEDYQQGTKGIILVSQHQHGGSRMAPYIATKAVRRDSGSKMVSISAMPVYAKKSHERLRWEYCQGTVAPDLWPVKDPLGVGSSRNPVCQKVVDMDPQRSLIAFIKSLPPRKLEPDITKRVRLFIRDHNGMPRPVRHPDPLKNPKSGLKKRLLNSQPRTH